MLVSDLLTSEFFLPALGTLGGVIVWLIGLTSKLAKTELKIDTLWDFQMRRGAAEIVQKGLGTMNSPVTLNEETRSEVQRLIADIAEPLRQLYRKIGRNVSDRDLAIELEVRFGDQIVKHLCTPLGMNEGACMHVVIDFLKRP